MNPLSEYKVALFLISAFVLINRSLHHFHLCLLTCSFCLRWAWSHHFPTEHEKGRKNCLYLVKIQGHFLVMMLYTFGSVQLWKWGNLLICFSAAKMLNSSSSDGWRMNALCYGEALSSWQQGGGRIGGSGIQHTVGVYRLCRALGPVNF